MTPPAATYRLQFNRNFRFADAQALAGYLARLGITHVYASPIFKARCGSTHGYDVTDPTRLNPELGTPEDFAAMVADLKRHGLGLVLDIVPNHMAASSENEWWMNVLERGSESPYAQFFDINWHPSLKALDRKVLLPILGKPYGTVLESQEIQLHFDERGFYASYFEHRLPLNVGSWDQLLNYRQEMQPPALAAAELRPERLWALYSGDAAVREFIDENVRVFNGRAGEPRSFDLLDRLMNSQCYWLSYWRFANEEINYRRFFALSELVSVRVEDQRVFDVTHELPLRLCREGMLSGLRVDHIDGLYDPEGYLNLLRERLSNARSCYLVVEKILTGEEPLPTEWPIAGTTGYDFLNTLNGLFIDPTARESLNRAYARFLGSELELAEIVYRKKKLILETMFAGEFSALTRWLAHLVGDDRYGHDLPPSELTAALMEVTACFPVYRTYIAGFKVLPRDRRAVERALEEAVHRNPEVAHQIYDFMRRLLLLERPAYLNDEQWELRLAFVRRWQQYTGPIIAKGLEDTAFYVYNRLLSLNEVGGDPEEVGLTPEIFHRRIRTRRQLWPHTMNATATHDTKRGEDMRARINVLSEIPQEWSHRVERWRRWNRGAKVQMQGRIAPDANEEYFIYQTLVGAWPLFPDQESAVLRSDVDDEFRERLRSYLVKAAREAKVYTRWSHPDEDHEKALADFSEAILTPAPGNSFLRDFVQFQRGIAHFGMLNALAQLLVKVAAPGLCDFYQGCELWDLSLVDPDNRRPVDFARRARMLEELDSAAAERRPARAFLRDLLSRWPDGRVKLFVASRALRFRREHPDMFLDGEYIGIEATGRHAEHLCAFIRCRGQSSALACVPRLNASLVRAGSWPLGRSAWGKTALVLPTAAAERWENVLTGESLKVRSSEGDKTLLLRDVFASLPVALLAAH